jgi:hypothetical protein
MAKDEFLELVKEIKDNDKEFEITPRELLNFFGCEKRTSGNVVFVLLITASENIKTRVIQSAIQARNPSLHKGC